MIFGKTLILCAFYDGKLPFNKIFSLSDWVFIGQRLIIFKGAIMQKRKWTYEERQLWIKAKNKPFPLFYYNKEDSAIFIRKRYGIAWTLNWGNPWSYIIMMFVILVSIIYF